MSSPHTFATTPCAKGNSYRGILVDAVHDSRMMATAVDGHQHCHITSLGKCDIEGLLLGGFTGYNRRLDGPVVLIARFTKDPHTRRRQQSNGFPRDRVRLIQ